MKIENFINKIYSEKLSITSGTHVLFQLNEVIELMKLWQEYNQVGSILYSYDPTLNQDELRIFTEDDFLTYVKSKLNNEIN